MTKKNIINIIEKKNLWFMISIIFILVGFGLMTNRAIKNQPLLNYGIDFVGGSSMLLKFEYLDSEYRNKAANGIDKETINISFISKIRDVLKNFNLSKNTIQITQNKEVIIKTLQLDQKTNLRVRNQLEKEIGKYELLEVDYIGPTIGKELREKSLWIVAIVAISLLIYITWRFEVTFGLAALAALIHDSLIMFSAASLFDIEINTIFVAAFLTVLGYSINDTIVLFDRIRENIPNITSSSTFKYICNLSINQTLTRTLFTSLTTTIVIISLLIFGGTTIKAFCLVLLIGVIAGTYSSIFIASPILNSLNKEN